MSDDIATDKAFRDDRGRFLPGSGGRPLGAKNKVPRSVLAQIQAMGDGAVQKLWQAVCLGESWAIQLVIQKILPAGRQIALEGFTADDLRDALINGDLDPVEAKTLSAVLKNLREIEDLDEIKAKLEELQQAVKGDE